jgi:hypothetical protein
LLKRLPDDKQILNDLAWIIHGEDKRYDAVLALANTGLCLVRDELRAVDRIGQKERNQ